MVPDGILFVEFVLVVADGFVYYVPDGDGVVGVDGEGGELG